MQLITLRSSIATKRGQHYDIIWTLRPSEQQMLLITLRSSTAMKRGQHYDIIWTLRPSEQPDAIDSITLIESDEAGAAL